MRHVPACEHISMPMTDGYQIRARWWPTGRRAAVLYLHGIQSHGQWFETSARFLAQRGLAVLLPDRRGAGRNERNINYRGLRRRLLRDVRQQIQWIQNRLHLGKIHLLGVSWGGKLAVAAYPGQHRSVKSMALIAPGLLPCVDVDIPRKLRIALAAMGCPARRFPIPLNAPDLFTANPEKRRFIDQDPLRLRETGAGFLLASRLMDSAKRKLAHAPPCPLHLFLAEHDRIIDNDATRAWAHSLGWKNTKVTLYDNAHHTLEFEPDPRPFFEDLADWLENPE